MEYKHTYFVACFIACPVLHLQYQRFVSPFLRVGLLLEDLDSFAADVASRHIGGLPDNATVVTASVEKIAFATAIQHRAQQQPADITAAVDVAAAAAAAAEQQAKQQQDNPGGSSESPMSIYTDLRIAGQVCWAGRSSMEVVIEISTKAAARSAADAAGRSTSSSGNSAADDGWIHRAVAHFMMVLRPTAVQQEGSSSGSRLRVPQVVPSTEIEQRNCDAGGLLAVREGVSAAMPYAPQCSRWCPHMVTSPAALLYSALLRCSELQWSKQLVVNTTGTWRLAP